MVIRSIHSEYRYMWCSINEVPWACIYMRYRHIAQLVLNMDIVACYTWGTVGIYEIQLVCIMCMGLNMRYSGHKRVKKYQSIHLAPPQLLLKVLVYLALIHFSRKYSFLKYTHFNINLAGYFIICHPKKAPLTHAQIRLKLNHSYHISSGMPLSSNCQTYNIYI